MRRGLTWIGLLPLLALWGCGSGSPPPAAPNAAAADEAASKANTGDVHEEKPIQLDAVSQRRIGLVLEAPREQAPAEPVRANGELKVNEDTTWQVGSVADGRVAAVEAKVGDAVRTGQVLARIHSHDVHEVQAMYLQAVNELRRVEAAEVYAKRIRDRAARLFELKAGSREQMEVAEVEYLNAQKRIVAARAQLEKERIHLTEFLDLPLPDQPADKSHPHDPRYEWVPVKAPATGTVMERKVTLGTVVSPGSEMFIVSNTASLWMIASVSETDIGGVRVGMPVRINVRAYPEQTFTGRVLRLGEKLDPETRMLQVRVLVPNPGGRLRPEMYATAEIERPGERKGVFVPEAAVQDLQNKPSVFVRSAPDTFSPRQVRTGVRSGGMIEVLEGLRAGELVVTKNAFLLKSQLLNKPEE